MIPVSRIGDSPHPYSLISYSLLFFVQLCMCIWCCSTVSNYNNSLKYSDALPKWIFIHASIYISSITNFMFGQSYLYVQLLILFKFLVLTFVVWNLLKLILWCGMCAARHCYLAVGNKTIFRVNGSRWFDGTGNYCPRPLQLLTTAY